MSSPKSAIPTVPRLLALAMRRLPLLPLQAMLISVFTGIEKRYPNIFERLGPHAGKRFGLDPTDLPFAFVLEPRPFQPRITAVRSLPAHLDARISGPLAALIGLVDGDLDGDALFFSRDLHVHGDVEAVLALRNAIDGEQIDLVQELLNGFGPLKSPGERILRDWLKPAGLSRAGTSGVSRWS